MCLSSIFEFFIMRQFGARLYHSKNLNVDYRTYLVLICVVNFEIFIFLNVMYDQDNVLKTGPVIKPVKCWVNGLLVELLNHWSNRMTKLDRTG
jgi:hypothetical protein